MEPKSCFQTVCESVLRSLSNLKTRFAENFAPIELAIYSPHASPFIYRFIYLFIYLPGLVPLPCSLASKRGLWHKEGGSYWAATAPICAQIRRNTLSSESVQVLAIATRLPSMPCFAITSPFLAHKKVRWMTVKAVAALQSQRVQIYPSIYLFICVYIKGALLFV